MVTSACHRCTTTVGPKSLTLRIVDRNWEVQVGDTHRDGRGQELPPGDPPPKLGRYSLPTLQMWSIYLNGSERSRLSTLPAADFNPSVSLRILFPVSDQRRSAVSLAASIAP